MALRISDEPGEAHTIEKWIYERLGIQYPFILRCYGEGESVLGKGLMLQYLSVGTIARNLELDKFPKERTQWAVRLRATFCRLVLSTRPLSRWPAQAVEPVRYIHTKGVFHRDISIHNFLVQEDGSIVLADFCGSILDDSTALISTATLYKRPIPLVDRSLNPIEKDDIFALGTAVCREKWWWGT
jgi:serine/threonine protein kinase